MTTLYSPETIRREKHRARCGFLAALILGLSALILCIALCFGIRTANAASRRNAVILISTLSGWCVILLVRGLILPEIREYRHEEGILYGVWDAAESRSVAEPPEIHEGVLLSFGDIFRIPKSISFFPVVLRVETEEEIQLRLNARCKAQFPPVGTKVRVKTIRRYITEFEVTEHA